MASVKRMVNRATKRARTKRKTDIRRRGDRVQHETERGELERSDLPFVARSYTFVFPTYDGPDSRLGDYEWSAGVCAIANTALRQGYRLLVRCRPDCVAPVTALMVRQLRGSVHVWWNQIYGVLILGLLEADQVDDEADAGDES